MAVRSRCPRRLLGFFAVSLLLTGVPVATVQAQWGSIEQVTGAGRDIAVQGDTAHVVWGFGTVEYRRSTDGGSTWSSPETLASGRIHLTDVIAANGSDVWVLYLADTTSFTDGCCPRVAGNIYLLRSRDEGESWEPPLQLTTSQKAFRISMAVSGERLHVVWMDYRSGNTWDIYYLRSPDRGSTWESEKLLVEGTPNNGRGASRPQVAAMGDGVHVTWLEIAEGKSANNDALDRFDVYYTRSMDGGSSWGSEVRLSPGDGHSIRPDVATVPPATVVVSFDDDRNNAPQGVEQFARRSTDNGSTWEPAVRLSGGGANHSHLTSSPGGSSMLHLAWRDVRDGEDSYYRLSYDGGETWEPEERINDDQSGGGVPLLSASSESVHALVGDGYHRRRTLCSGVSCNAGEADAGGMGAGVDGGAGESPGGGCGCRSGAGRAHPWLILSGLVGLFFLRRRARRARRGGRMRSLADA